MFLLLFFNCCRTVSVFSVTVLLVPVFLYLCPVSVPSVPLILTDTTLQLNTLPQFRYLLLLFLDILMLTDACILCKASKPAQQMYISLKCLVQNKYIPEVTEIELHYTLPLLQGEENATVTLSLNSVNRIAMSAQPRSWAYF